MIRLLLPGASGAGEVEVSGERLHYLARVLRLAPGDALEVFDGRGSAHRATVKAIEEQRATVVLGEAVEAPRGGEVTIVQGLPKGDKLELVLQKGTELGAAAFAPVHTARAVVKLTSERAADKVRRWQKIAEEAARQCGRADVPQVLPVRGLIETCRELAATAVVLVLDEEERATRLSHALAQAGEGTPLAVVIGPEGGLSREEVQALTGLGAVPVTLGERVLRTETASLAALSIIEHRRGRLG